MGNISNKNKLEETFDAWEIPIIIKSISCEECFFKNKKAIEDNTDDKLLILLTHINIGCSTYQVYTNKMYFQLCKSNSFVLNYDIESKEIKYHFISESLCSFLKIYPINSESKLTLKSFFNLFSKSSLHNFKSLVNNTIKYFNNKFLWNGLLYLSERYSIFQIDAEIEYSDNSAILYCNLSDIQHIFDKNIKSIHKTENVDFVPRNIDIISSHKNNISAVNIHGCMKQWLDKRKIDNYFINPDLPTYVVLDKEKLFTVINYFYRNIELFEIHCNHYFLILRFQTKNISSMTYFCKNIINYIHQMKGTIYYTDNIVEIRIPYEKDNCNRPEKEIITAKKNLSENITVYLIDHNKINRENTKKYLKNKYIPVIDGDKIKDIDIYNHRPNSILIYNSDVGHNIDILRERGVIMPVIISDSLKKCENYYNYSLSYPFNNEQIYKVLIDIKTRINILYLDKTVKNSILVKNMLDRLESYNIYIESRLDKLDSIINSLEIQLIILDSSILSFYLSDYPTRAFKNLGVDIPILFIQNNKQCNFDYYTEKIHKPFNLETLNEKIINCFS